MVYCVSNATFQDRTNLIFPQHGFAHKLSVTLGTAKSLLAVFIFSATRQEVSLFYDFSTTAKDALESFTTDMITSTFRSNFLAIVTGAVVTMTVVRCSTMTIFCATLWKKYM
jgi:hypothetical protein